MAGISLMFCYEDITEGGFISYNFGFLALYLGVLVFQRFAAKPAKSGKKDQAVAEARLKILKSVGIFAFLGIMVCEMVLGVITFSATFPSTNNPQMPVGPNDASTVIDYMKEQEQDNLFYRAESTQGKTLNDGALYGFNGITAFTSSANVNVTKFMVALGFSGKDTYNRYSYGESSPVSNLFLNLKYMIERDGELKENPYFEDVYSSGNVHLLENNAYLPLGFLTDPQLADVDFAYSGDPFQFQNELLSAATGIDSPVWTIMEDLEISPPASGPQVTPDGNSCTYDNSNNENSSHIVYKFTAETSGLVCMYIERSEDNDYSFWHSDYATYLSVSNYSLPIMSSVCAVEPGDEVSVWLNVKENATGDAKVYAAVLDEEIFREHYNKLAESTLDITSFSNTNIEGTITAKEGGLMYTSIPQNGNWEAFVDGEAAEILTVGNVMVSVMIPEGEHTVQFVYRNSSFTLGMAASIASTLILIAAAVVLYNPGIQNRFRRTKQ